MGNGIIVPFIHLFKRKLRIDLLFIFIFLEEVEHKSGNGMCSLIYLICKCGFDPWKLT